MRKISALIIFVFLFFMFQNGSIVKANSFNDSSRNYVVQSISNILCHNKGICGEEKIKLKKEKLYDIKLDNFGYVYTFELQSNKSIQGFLILKSERKISLVQEIHITDVIPYIDSKLVNIYAGFGNYYELYKDILLNRNDKEYYYYREILGGYGLDNQKIDKKINGAKGFIGDLVAFEGTSSLVFYSKDSNKVTTTSSFPFADQIDLADKTGTTKNNCSVASALTLVMFYEDLFPSSSVLYDVKSFNSHGDSTTYNNTSYYFKENNSIPYSQRGLLLGIYNELFFRFNTSDLYGTPHQNMINGLEEYYNQRGYDTSINMMIGLKNITNFSNKSFDELNLWATYKSSIDNNIPVVMQLGGLTDMHFSVIDDISYEENYSSKPGPYHTQFDLDNVTYHYRGYYSLAMHTVVGYGYLENAYYDINVAGYQFDLSLIREDSFAIISYNNGSYVYLSSNNKSVSQAYSFNISPY